MKNMVDNVKLKAIINPLTGKLRIERLRVRHLAAPKGQRRCLDDYNSSVSSNLSASR